MEINRLISHQRKTREIFLDAIAFLLVASEVAYIVTAVFL